MRKILYTACALLLLASLLFAGCTSSPEKNWQEQYDLGIRYLSDGEYEQAIIAFTAAIAIDGLKPEPYIGRAEAYTAVEDYSAAKADYDKAQELAPEDAQLQEKINEFYQFLQEIGWVAPDAPTDPVETAAEAIYQPVLQMYMESAGKQEGYLTHEDDRNALKANGAVTMYGYGTEYLYYALVDLSQDGTPELFIALHLPEWAETEYLICDIFSFENDVLTRPFDPYPMGYEVYYSICQNGVVSSYEYHGGAAESLYYRMPALSDQPWIFDSVSYEYDGDYTEVADRVWNHNGDAITQAQASAIEAQYVRDTAVQWRPLSLLTGFADPDRELVYDLVNETVAENDWWTGPLSYRLPQIALPGEDAEAINREIYQNYYEAVQSSLTSNSAGEMPWLGSLEYSWSVNENILSLIITAREVASDHVSYSVYNLDTQTGRQLTNEALLTALRMDRTGFYARAAQKLEERARVSLAYDLAAENADWRKMGEDMLAQTLADENLQSIRIYLDETGSLHFIATIYILAGAGYYDTPIAW